MTFPAQSTAWSSSPDSLWWRSRYEGAIHVCETQGRTALVREQGILIADLPIVFTVDGTLYRRASIGADGNLGPATLAGTYWYLENRLDTPTAMLQGVLNDLRRLTASGSTRTGARGQPVSLQTQQAVLWIGIHRTLMAADAVILPDDIITWRFAIEAPNDGADAGLVTCTLESELTAGGSRDNASPGGSGDTALNPPDVGGESGGDDWLAILLALGLVAAASSDQRGKKRR